MEIDRQHSIEQLEHELMYQDARVKRALSLSHTTSVLGNSPDGRRVLIMTYEQRYNLITGNQNDSMGDNPDLTKILVAFGWVGDSEFRKFAEKESVFYDSNYSLRNSLSKFELARYKTDEALIELEADIYESRITAYVNMPENKERLLNIAVTSLSHIKPHYHLQD